MLNPILLEQLRYSPEVRAVLSLLLDARQGARATDMCEWTFATALPDLLMTGCTQTQLRLLLYAGFVEHSVEVTRDRARTRSFRPAQPMFFAPGSCFVITDSGATFLKLMKGPPGQGHRAAADENSPMRDRTTPVWDALSRELRVGKRLLTRFRRPAPVLELLLTAFQELGWPVRMDDPLWPAPGIEPQGRLRDAVRRLYLCQNPFMIHFMTDGSGHGVRWELAGRVKRSTTEARRKSRG